MDEREKTELKLIRWCVTYECEGNSYTTDPYSTSAEAESHRLDIAGYAGIENVRLVPVT